MLRHLASLLFSDWEVCNLEIQPSWEARIIQEYCSHGNLRQNLKSGMLEGQSMIEPQKPCPPSIATSLTLLLDVAAGLAFIHASNVTALTWCLSRHFLCWPHLHFWRILTLHRLKSHLVDHSRGPEVSKRPPHQP